MDRDRRDNSDSARGEESPETEASAERRRILVIALFVAGSLALALVLAVFYSMPSAG